MDDGRQRLKTSRINSQTETKGLMKIADDRDNHIRIYLIDIWLMIGTHLSATHPFDKGLIRVSIIQLRNSRRLSRTGQFDQTVKWNLILYNCRAKVQSCFNLPIWITIFQMRIFVVNLASQFVNLFRRAVGRKLESGMKAVDARKIIIKEDRFKFDVPSLTFKIFTNIIRIRFGCITINPDADTEAISLLVQKLELFDPEAPINHRLTK